MRKKGKFESGARVLVSTKGHRDGSKLLMAFVSSFMSLVLCCTMFLSTTMAWFTDTIVSAGNQIKIGTLAVDVLYNGQSLNPKKNPNTIDLFGNITWEPGRFVSRTLTVKNEGDLDVIYMLNLVIGEKVKPEVAAHFDVYVNKTGNVEDRDDQLNEAQSIPNGWEHVGNLTDIQIYAMSNELAAANTAGGISAETFGIALYMKDGSADDFGETFDVNVWLHATQTGADEPSQTAFKMVRPTKEATEPVETTVATEATVPQVKTTKKLVSQAKPTETTAPQTEPTETTAPQTEPTETTAPQTEPTETTVPQTEPTETTVPQTEPTETTVPQIEPTETTAPQTEPTETTVPQTEPTAATTVPTEAPTETTVSTTPTEDGQQ